MTRSELSIYFTNEFCNIETEKDIVIRRRVEDHLIEAINNGININQVVFIALEGSQNYKLDTISSDVDTKLIVVPSLDDIIYGRRYVSHTHIRENNEHTGIFDIRFYLPVLKKQNINFVETLFSPWIIVNRKYLNEIKLLLENRELIARYNKVKAVKTMGGIATDRYKAIWNINSARADIIEKYGYDGKSVSHLLRLYYSLNNYIKEKPYEECIVPEKEYREDILFLKNNKMPSNIIESYVAWLDYKIHKMVDNYVNTHQETTNPEVDTILDKIQTNIIKKALGVI